MMQDLSVCYLQAKANPLSGFLTSVFVDQAKMHACCMQKSSHDPCHGVMNGVAWQIANMTAYQQCVYVRE